MSTPITSFFKKTTTPTKKRKSDDDGDASNDPNKKALSPEQKEKIKKNKIEALRKIAITKGVPVEASMGSSWRHALKAEFTKQYFKELLKFLEGEKAKKVQVFPPPQDVYSWSQYCDIDDVKVVILGQDPYHDNGQAHGLCFSVKPGVRVPPSLANMYKELTTDIEGFKTPKHGFLESWATQGVLMLNAVLTVQAHKANSHKGKGWEKFTDAIIAWINKNQKNVVFILWGKKAQDKGKKIDQSRHLILKGNHPSPLSAYQGKGYFGCKHFSQTNAYLKSKGKTEIDWTSICD